MAATWCIHSNLRVTYHHPLAKDGEIQELGKPEPGFGYDDVLGWAARGGDAGDIIVTGRGVYFIQGSVGVN